MIRDLIRSIRAVLVLWVLTGLLYPAVLLAIGLVFPAQANGSLIRSGDTIVGSALIGQPFTSDRYFNSRPSTTDYSTSPDVATTGTSGASNLAPSNPDLIERVQETAKALQQANIQPIADLVYTSGSSLDPHISPAAARAQIDRLTATRNVSADQLQRLISENTDRRFLNLFGEPGVNVLRLNRALDAL